MGDFMDYCIEKSQSLDILCRPWAPSPPPRTRSDTFQHVMSDRSEGSEGSYRSIFEDHPSWISLISSAQFVGSRIKGRFNGDAFVQHSANVSKSSYNASFGSRPVAQFGRRSVSHSAGQLKVQSISRLDGDLLVKGLVLGLVNRVSNRVSNGKVIPHDGLQMCGLAQDFRSLVGFEHGPDESWRILVADHDFDGDQAPHLYGRALLECLQYVSRDGDLDLEELRTAPQTDQTLCSVTERMQCILWGRSFFNAESPGTWKAFFPRTVSTCYHDRRHGGCLVWL